MRVFTPHFDNVIVVIQESNTLETMKMEDLIGSLEEHELSFLQRNRVQELVQALQAWNSRKMVVLRNTKTKGSKRSSKNMQNQTYKSLNLMVKFNPSIKEEWNQI